MKHILVPVDFSETAKNAMRYAVQIANKTDASITCFYAYIYAENLMESFEIVKSKVEQQLNSFTEEFKSSVAIECVAYPSGFDKAMVFLSEIKKIDLIIMGTGTATTFKKIISGSNATHALFKTKIPFLIVPEKTENRLINNILFSSDLKPLENREVLEPIKKIAKAYSATVTIAHVQTELDDKYDTLEELEKENNYFGSGIKHVFKHIGNTDINQGIRYFINNEACDLFVMVRREYGFLANLFREEHIFEFVNKPDLPVLIIHC